MAFVISYLSFSIPAVIAGMATTHAGLQQTFVVYAATVAVLCALALLAQRLRSARTRAAGTLPRA
ncbi:hypothetical protein [Streptomyces longwoodensis]|uniref:hypothetical protein n=1 Tax=Streptomyces longwoodensis TaxID=68231 RepID=UPI003850AB42